MSLQLGVQYTDAKGQKHFMPLDSATLRDSTVTNGVVQSLADDATFQKLLRARFGDTAVTQQKPPRIGRVGTGEPLPGREQAREPEANQKPPVLMASKPYKGGKKQPRIGRQMI